MKTNCQPLSQSFVFISSQIIISFGGGLLRIKRRKKKSINKYNLYAKQYNVYANKRINQIRDRSRKARSRADNKNEGVELNDGINGEK